MHLTILFVSKCYGSKRQQKKHFKLNNQIYFMSSSRNMVVYLIIQSQILTNTDKLKENLRFYKYFHS